MLVMLPASAQKLIAEKTVVDVGKTGFQQPITAVFEFRNKNAKRLRIEAVNPDCNCTAVEYPKDVIGTGESFQIKMTYDAKRLGHFDYQAAVVSNATKAPIYIRMKGIVLADYQDYSGDYPIEMGNMRIDKNELEFDDINKGEQPIEQIHVYNNGTSLMHPNLMHLPSWLSATPATEKLRPGRTATSTGTLNSHQGRDYTLTR